MPPSTPDHEDSVSPQDRLEANVEKILLSETVIDETYIRDQASKELLTYLKKQTWPITFLQMGTRIAYETIQNIACLDKDQKQILFDMIASHTIHNTIDTLRLKWVENLSGPVITVRASLQEQELWFELIDNGVGLKTSGDENYIGQLGFTTKKNLFLKDGMIIGGRGQGINRTLEKIEPFGWKFLLLSRDDEEGACARFVIPIGH